MDEIQILQRFGERELKKCIKGLLTQGYYNGIYLQNGDSPLAYTGFMSIYDNSDRKLQRRLRKAVASLVAEFNHDKEPLEYLDNLVIIVGQTKNLIAYGALGGYAAKGLFKGRISNGIDIHSRLLDVLGEINAHGSQAVFQRDIGDTRYVVSCFRGLNEIGYELAKEHVGKLITHVRGLGAGSPPRHLFFREFAEKAGPDFLYRNAHSFSINLPKDDFRELAEYIGKLCPEVKKYYDALAV